MADWRGGSSAGTALIIGANTISASYSGLTPASLTWSPTSSNPYAWNVVSTYNWKNSGTGDVFYHGDAVTFPAGTSGTVNVASNVYPSSITFQNTGTFYITGTARDFRPRLRHDERHGHGRFRGQQHQQQ